MEIEFLINHYFQKLANHLVRFQQVRYGYVIIFIIYIIAKHKYKV